MKVMSVYSIRPGCAAATAKRFLAGDATPPAGIKLLGRWHKSDGSGGYSLFEVDSVALLYQFAVSWAEVLEIHSTAVIEDAEAGPALAKVFGK